MAAAAQDFDCVLVRGFLDDPQWGWYKIERKEHDGREWQEQGPGWTAHCSSARLEPFSTVEGRGEEMREIADAIERGDSYTSTRCAAERVDGGYLVYSPRNTEPEARTLMSFAAAARIAAEIRRKVV